MEGQEIILGAIMGRVSGQKQKRDDTIQTQLAECRAWCERHGVRVDERHIYLDENVTNTTPYDERPAAREMFAAAARREFQVVVCYKSSRMSRLLELFEEGRRRLLACGVGLQCIKSDLRYGNASEKMSSRIQLMVDEWDRDNQQENFMAGKRRVARLGAYTGGGRPYGYDTQGAKPTRLVIYEPEAEVLRRAYRLVVEGLMTCWQVCQIFNREGIPCPSRARPGVLLRPAAHCPVWQPTVLAKLLRKPLHQGQRPYRDEQGQPAVAAVPHLAIVEPALWAAAQRRLAENHHASGRHGAGGRYLLSGKVYCGLHECSMIGETHAADARFPREVRRYVCNFQRAERAGFRVKVEGECPCRRAPADPLERAIWDELESALRDWDGTAARLAAGAGHGARRRQELEAALAALQREEQRHQGIKSAAMQGLSPQGWELTPADARAAYQAANQRLATLAAETRGLMETLAQSEATRARLGEIEAHLRYWHERLDNLSRGAKRHLVQLFVDRIWVRRDSEGVYYETVFCFARQESAHRVIATPSCRRRWS